VISPEKICVIHLSQIGDMAFAMPLLKALRENFPGASIHSVVKPYLKELLNGSAYVDKILLRKGTLADKGHLLATLRRNRYDLLICLPHSEECMMMTALSRAGIKAGFSNFPWDLGLHIKETIEGHNCWYNNAKLLKRLNLSIPQNNYVGLIQTDANIDELDLPSRYVVISPGASQRRLTKTWPNHCFSQLAATLWAKYALTPILVGGKDNVETNAGIIEEARRQDTTGELAPVDLTGRHGLRTLCAVLKQARLFVGIDSGVMHLASAVDIPVVGLFGPTDPFYVGPQNKKSRVVRQTDMDCVPCYLKKCRHMDCMQHLSVDQVLAACDDLLAQPPLSQET
jgi:ADP-heptose:LPS heptosyltransferase